MKITEIKPVTIDEEVTVDIICNVCGNSCKDREGMNYEGLLEASVQGGYASKLGDMLTYTFSICEGCLENIFKTFKHPPETYNPMSHGEDDPAVVAAWEKQVAEETAKHTGE